MKLLALLVSLCLLGAGSLQARTPEEAVTAYLAAVKKDGMAGIAPLMHPAELVKFRTMFAPLLTEALKNPQGRQLFADFIDPADATRLRTLTDAAFLSAFLKMIETAQPQVTALLKSATTQVLGHVKENDTSHVVVRMKVSTQGISIDQVTVVPTRLHNGEPMMALTGEITGLLEGMKQAFGVAAP